MPITPVGGTRGFLEIPDDPDLAGFDPSDRKFLAVAIASGERAPILNAADTDWWHHREALSRQEAAFHTLFEPARLVRVLDNAAELHGTRAILASDRRRDDDKRQEAERDPGRGGRPPA